MNADLSKLAADFGVTVEDVTMLASATYGRFELMTAERRGAVAAASLRVWRALGDTAARNLYLKIREGQGGFWKVRTAA